MWWKKFPYSVSHSVIDVPDSYKKDNGTLLSRVSLVYNIEEIIGSYNRTTFTGSGMDGRGTSLVSRDFRAGYKFQSIDVDGRSSQRLLLMYGPPKVKYEPIRDEDPGRWLLGRGERIIDRNPNGFGNPWIPRFAREIDLPPDKIILSDHKPDTLKQILASAYLNTRSSFRYTEIKSGGIDGEPWPFDKDVPQ